MLRDDFFNKIIRCKGIMRCSVTQVLMDLNSFGIWANKDMPNKCNISVNISYEVNYPGLPIIHDCIRLFLALMPK